MSTIADPWVILATSKLRIGGDIKCVGFKPPPKSKAPPKIAKSFTLKKDQVLIFATKPDADKWCVENAATYWDYKLTPTRMAECTSLVEPVAKP